MSLKNVTLGFDHHAGDVVLVEHDGEGNVLEDVIITGMLMRAVVTYLADGEELEVGKGVEAKFGWGKEEHYRLELRRMEESGENGWDDEGFDV